MSNKKQNLSKREIRKLRTQQILFSLVALMIILVMVIGLFAKY